MGQISTGVDTGAQQRQIAPQVGLQQHDTRPATLAEHVTWPASSRGCRSRTLRPQISLMRSPQIQQAQHYPVPGVRLGVQHGQHIVFGEDALGQRCLDGRQLDGGTLGWFSSNRVVAKCLREAKRLPA